MTYAALIRAVLALSGGLEPGPEPVSAWGDQGENDPVCRLFRSQGGAAAFAAALTRTLFTIARRLPEVAAVELIPPISFGCLAGAREVKTPLTLPVPGCRGVSLRYRGRGTLLFGDVQKRLARDTVASCRVVGRADMLTLSPDPGQTLWVWDVAPFGEGATAATLPLLRGTEAIYDLSALCPRYAVALSVTKPARVVGDTLILPRFRQEPVTLTAALFPPHITADDVLQNGGGDEVPVPAAAAPALAWGVAADLYAAEPDLPATLWREQFRQALDALPAVVAEGRVGDKRGWL